MKKTAWIGDPESWTQSGISIKILHRI